MSSTACASSTAANGRPTLKMPTIDLELERKLASFNQVPIPQHTFFEPVVDHRELLVSILPVSWCLRLAPVSVSIAKSFLVHNFPAVTLAPSMRSL